MGRSLVLGAVLIYFTVHVYDCRYVPRHNVGDRYGLFRFVVPSRYLNSTLGPETYHWLVAVYGKITVDKAVILMAPSDSHECGTDGGWCKESCDRGEEPDWLLKDVCGRYHCCISRTNIIPAS